MRRTLFILLVAATAACGGQQKPSAAHAPLPPDTAAASAEAETPATSPAEAPKPEEAKPATPAAPPAPPKPIEVTIASPKVSVKVLSKGHGKHARLAFTPKAGDKQEVELAMDFKGKQSAPPELGGTVEQAVPTLVLTGDAEVKSVAKDGTSEFVLTVKGTDARQAAGKPVPPDKAKDEQTKLEQAKAALAELQGLTIGGTVGANGAAGDVKLRMEKPSDHSAEALDLVRLALPTWPVLPSEPVGVGAKWRVTVQTKVADQLDVTQTTDYQLVAHKGKTWTIKGKTKVTGADQQIPSAKPGVPPAKFSKVSGQGTVEVALVDGTLYPQLEQKLSTGFTVSMGEADPKDPKSKPVEVTFGLEQGAKITPKAETN